MPVRHQRTLLQAISAAIRGAAKASEAADAIALHVQSGDLTPEALEMLRGAVQTTGDAMSRLVRCLKDAQPNGVPHSVAILAEARAAELRILREAQGSINGVDIDGFVGVRGGHTE